MSLLQETRSQYADFSNTASCGDLKVAGSIITPLVTGDALEPTSVVSATVQSSSIVAEALQLTTTPAAGAVLTSDATGNASWQPLPAFSSSSLAYGYSIGEGATTILGGNYITFDFGTVIDNGGFTSVPGPPTGSSYIIETAGVYEYSFYVLAANGAGTTQALEMAVVSTSINLNVGIPPNIFRSALARADGDSMVCRGSGIFTLTVGDLVSVQNITNSSTTSINLLPAGGAAAVNRTFSLKRLA